ncbi:MAG: excisionase family DNA-binding protein [Acidimicrobiales bacterium]
MMPARRVGLGVPGAGPPAVADDGPTYRRDLDKYVLPRFGAYRIGRLPADEIENWLNGEVAAGIAPSAVHRHYRTLRRMLQVAVEKQKLPANPCNRVHPPRVPKRDMAFLSWDETAASRAVLLLLEELGAGSAVHLVPTDAELTTQQSADLLGIARTYLIRLIEDGKLPAHLVGTHRRLRAADVLDYKDRRAARLAAVDAIADAEVGIDYR